jgi:hypothetical protein
MKTILAVLATFSSFILPPAVLAATPWEWVKVNNNVSSGWHTEKGAATVNIKDDHFEAVLFEGGNPNTVQIKLTGMISKGKINATETILDTDISPAQFTGTYKKLKWREKFEGASGTEAITLSDGFNLIGIRRNIAE